MTFSGSAFSHSPIAIETISMSETRILTAGFEKATSSKQPCDQTNASDVSSEHFENREGNITWTRVLETLPCDTPLVKNLDKISRIRPLTLRKGVCINLHIRRNHQAALGQTRGAILTTACGQCLLQQGPFVDCVVVGGCFGGACCNCYFRSRANQCSLHRSGKLYLYGLDIN